MLVTIVILFVVAGIVAYRVSSLKKATAEDFKPLVEEKEVVLEAQPKKELKIKDRPKQDAKPKQKAAKPKEDAKKQEAKEPKKEQKIKTKNKK